MSEERKSGVDALEGQLGVLIVGAGPTGLTLAAQVHALGASVRIVDRQLDRVHESRALAVQPRTLEVLRALGISEQLVARGNDAVQLRLHFGERVVPIRLFDVGLDDTAYPFLLFISQAETEAVLNEHLAEHGIEVERGVELVTFSTGEQYVRCTLRHRDGITEQLRARYLVRRRPGSRSPPRDVMSTPAPALRPRTNCAIGGAAGCLTVQRPADPGTKLARSQSREGGDIRCR
jgi:2-polyprenyl-6-methoxyphenol hydroxylase-like FAD-dependent oxidoreductase